MVSITEIINILGNPQMALAGCFWVFDERGTASQIRYTNFMQVFEDLNKFLGEKAIWIREMENYSHKMRSYCEKVNSINSHIIIAPKEATVLSRHYDVWNVYIKMLYGSRRYEVEGKDILLKAGETLLIKKGEMHQVFPLEPSVTINFGVEKEQVKFEPLAEPYTDYPYNFSELFKENTFLNKFI